MPRMNSDTVYHIHAAVPVSQEFFPSPGLFCILPEFGTVPGNVSAFENVSAEFPVPLLPELLPEKRFAAQFYLLL